MPGNCGVETTDWFREESYFSIAAASTEKLVETRTCLCLSCHTLVSVMKDQAAELTHLGLRAFAIGFGDQKGEKTFNHVSIFICICISLKGFTSRWSNSCTCRSFRTTSWCSTLIWWIYQLLQRFIATAGYYCAKMNHTHDYSVWHKKGKTIHSGKFTPRCKQFPSILTSAAKTTLILTRSRRQFFVFQPVSNWSYRHSFPLKRIQKLFAETANMLLFYLHFPVPRNSCAVEC